MASDMDEFDRLLHGEHYTVKERSPYKNPFMHSGIKIWQTEPKST